MGNRLKQASQELQRSEKRLRSLLQNSTEGLTLLDAHGRVTARSPAALKILGLKEKETPNRFRTDLVHPEDLDLVLQTCAHIRKNPCDSCTIEYRLLAGGSYKWIETTLSNLLQEPAVEAIVLNFRDVTRKKVDEITHRENEDRLRQAQAIGHIANWELNVAEASTFWSEELFRILGADPAAVQPSPEAFAAFIHPEDLPGFLSRMEQIRHDSRVEDYYSLRIVRPDGEIRYTNTTSQTEIDDQGRLVRIFGILQDITDMRMAEQAVEQSEKKYRSLFNFSPTPMWVYDAQTLVFLEVNEAAIRHYGYSKEEFAAMTLRDIRPKAEIAKMEEVAFSLRSESEAYHGTFQHLTKAGELIEVDIQSSSLDIDGRRARLVIATDISQKVRYLQAIEAQNARLKEIAWTQSHVVRAPLARLMGLTGLLQELPPEQRNDAEIFDFILASAQELDAIIRDIVSKTAQIKDQPIQE
ncbi:MAG: PAS domain S-box protein [Adhaeribacter sp.]